jgi:hypothetical protein
MRAATSPGRALDGRANRPQPSGAVPIEVESARYARKAVLDAIEVVHRTAEVVAASWTFEWHARWLRSLTPVYVIRIGP